MHEPNSAETARLQLHVVVSMPFAENSYVAWLQGRDDCLVFDPGFDPESILDFVRERGLRVAAILNTHGHGDHVAGNAAMKEAFPDAPLMIGVNDAKLLSDAEANMSAPFGIEVLSPPADRLLREGDVVDAAGIRLEVLDVPGHSPGHIVFIHRSQPTIVFGGDVLFQGSIGRYDFPGSDGRLLVSGIRNKLFQLPDDAVVYSGHGPKTTIGQEKRTNPFVGQHASSIE